jgi:hypothetical protein
VTRITDASDAADAFLASYEREYDAHIRFVVDQMRAAYPHLKDAEIANLLALYIDMKGAGFSSAAIATALEGEIGRR